MISQPVYQILLFYKYVHIEDPESVRNWLHTLCVRYQLKGRLIVGTEGLNCTLEGDHDATERFIVELETDDRFQHIHFKRSVGIGNAFPRLSVKTRSEIVSGHLGVCDVDPNQRTGKRITAEMLHAWIHSDKRFFIIDMRNRYEHEVGKFAGSICPPMENFRNLSKIIKSIAHLKHETVVTVCTGGIRCEKASGYLLNQGFTDVWQLDGGIVTYMEKYPNEDFEGKLYVFDGRVTMGFYTDDPRHIIIGKCSICGQSSERFVNCRNEYCGMHFIVCESCDTKQFSGAAVTCPKGCRVLKAKKLKSPIRRLWHALWTK